MQKMKEDLSVVSYVLGIASIVMAFFNSGAGIVFGIIGLVQTRRYNTPLAKRAKKLNIIGLIISIILLILSLALLVLGTTNPGLFPNLPLN
jgi:predicted small integral membrane protein